MDNDAKIEQYQLLARSAKGLALVDLIGKAAAEPGLFAFGELLSLPSHPAKYTLLSEPQARKLKLLTMVSMANSVRTIGYAELQAAVEVGNVRQLEDMLITDCFYSGLIRGKLDQEHRCLHVEETFCRDVPPDRLAGVAESLGSWLGVAHEVLAGIEARVGWTQEAMAAASKKKADLQQELEAEKKSVKTSIELQAQQESSGMMLDDSDAFGGLEEDARPAAGRHSKRRR
eukprot:scaffold1.g5621.t1